MEENTKVTTNTNEEENWTKVLENTLVTLNIQVKRLRVLSSRYTRMK